MSRGLGDVYKRQILAISAPAVSTVSRFFFSIAIWISLVMPDVLMLVDKPAIVIIIPPIVYIYNRCA